MSETNQQVSPQDTMQFLAQLLGIVPEWSTSKQQFEPIDQGTIRNHQSMVGSYASMAQDPMMLALMNAIQPSAFDPVVTETPKPQPTAPSSTTLSRYSSDPAREPLLALIMKGYTPGTAAKLFVNSLNYPQQHPDPENATDEEKEAWALDEIKQMTAEAELLREEIASEEQYANEMAEWEANPVERVEEESAAAKTWREAGLINPFEQFTKQDFYPGYQDSIDKLKKPLDAYEAAMREYGREGGNISDDIMQRGRLGGVTVEQLGRPTGIGASVGGFEIDKEPVPIGQPGEAPVQSVEAPDTTVLGNLPTTQLPSVGGRSQGVESPRPTGNVGYKPTSAQIARAKAMRAHEALRASARENEPQRVAARWQVDDAARRGETPFMRQLAQVFGYNPQRR